MKNYISICFVTLFVMHIVITIAINFTGLSFLKDKNNCRVNSFGKFYIEKIADYNYPQIIKSYANYTGIGHGYSYYSPNLPDTKINYSFYNQNAEVKNIVMMSESKLKFKTLMDNITIYSKDSNVRKNILESIYRNILLKNPKVAEIKVNIEMGYLKHLNEYYLGKKRDSIFKIKAYIIKNETSN